MRIWDAGSGPPLLAVHGLGGSGRYFDTLARALEGRYRVIAPDLPGFGHSDKPDAAYEPGFHLEALDAALASGGVHPDAALTLVGHSLGAVLAAFHAGRNLEATAALALLAAPFPSGDGDPPWMRRELPVGWRMAGRVLKVTWPAIAVPVGLARGYPVGVTLDFGKQTMHSRTRTMHGALYDPAVLAEVISIRRLPATTPQLLLNAADDRTVPPETQARWAAVLPHAERKVVVSGGHQFPLRSGFAPVVRWLSEISPSAAAR
jgi:pimeloyl-ACP methyl ester carboxylesterase